MTDVMTFIMLEVSGVMSVFKRCSSCQCYYPISDGFTVRNYKSRRSDRVSSYLHPFCRKCLVDKSMGRYIVAHTRTRRPARTYPQGLEVAQEYADNGALRLLCAYFLDRLDEQTQIKVKPFIAKFKSEARIIECCQFAPEFNK